MKHYSKKVCLQLLRPLLLLAFIMVAVPSLGQKSYEVTSNNLNVRASASTRSSLIGSLGKGESVQVQSISGGWAKIKYKGRTGYVSAQYLREKASSNRSTVQERKPANVAPQRSSSHVAQHKSTPRKQSQARHRSRSHRTNDPLGLKPFVELQPVIVCAKGAKPFFEINGGVTKGINNYLSLGAGLGLSSNFHAPPLVPLFARMQLENKAAEFSPLFLLDAGYDFNFKSIKNSNIRLNPTVGIKTSGVYAGVGYLAAISTAKNGGVGHNVNIKVGYEFGSDFRSTGFGRALSNFFRQTYVAAEVGGGLGFNKEKSLFLAATWNYAANNIWHIGVGLGYTRYFIPNDDESIHTNIRSLPYFIRNKFYVANISKGIRIFSGLDLGLNKMWRYYRLEDEGDIIVNGQRIGQEDIVEKDDWTRFFVRPHVGVEFKDRFNATIGYRHTSIIKYMDVDDSPSASIPSIDFTVGVKF